MNLEACWVYRSIYGWICGVALQVSNAERGIVKRWAMALPGEINGYPMPMTAEQTANAMVEIAALAVAEFPDATYTKSANSRWPIDTKFA